MRLWITGLILAGLLVACSGDASEEQELPTRVVIGETTAEVTEEPTPEVASPENTPEAQPTEEATVPVVPPPPPVSAPSAETTQEADIAAPSGVDDAAELPPITSDAVEDFSTLSEGDVVLLRGTVLVEDELVFIEDEGGERIELLTPLAMAQGVIGQTIEIAGEVIAGNDGLALVVNAINIAGQDTPDIPQQPAPETTASVPFPGGELPPMSDGELLYIQLDAELTLLQTYDALIPQLELGEQTIWTRASGSSNAGWTFDFLDQDSGMQTRYTVTPSGEVSQTVIATETPIPGMQMQPIERDEIVVDSADVLDQIDENNDTPFGAPPLVLIATEDGGITWTVQGPQGETFDATTPLE